MSLISLTYYVILVISTAFFGAVLTGVAWLILRQGGLMDQPNERSNHAIATPRGGGIAVTAVMFAFFLVADVDSSVNGHVLIGALLIAAISFYDDWRGVPPQDRLAVQLLAVALGIASIQGDVSQGLLPYGLDVLLVVPLWLWMTNLTNFMDGIDGISGTEAISIGLGLGAVVLAAPDTLHHSISLGGGVIAGTMFGFLLWNWPPARIFLGDVGSVPLGYLLGFLLLQLAGAGYWQAALILPAYYILDATVTLIRRLMAGKKIWEAHSEHAYQIGVRRSGNHGVICETLLMLNIVLIMLAVISTAHWVAGLVCLGLAYLFSALLMGYFARMPAAAHEIRA